MADIGFYSGLLRGRRRTLLLGPYPSKLEAEQNLERAHKLACDVDLFCWFDAPVIIRLEAEMLPRGRLNG